MVSRKRNKGKERKAKKAEKAANEAEIAWRRTVQGKDENDNKIIQCDHDGCAVTLSDHPGHPIFSFMDSFMKMNLEGINGVYILLECTSLLDGHPEIWTDKSHREMAMKILLRIGTNMIIFNNKRSPTTCITFASRMIANLITILENYDEKITDMEDILYIRSIATNPNLHAGNLRDLLKFYSKRITCSCLKKIYSDARKTLPKAGCCYNCREVKERSSLSVCSRCRINQYCSRECQIEHWPTHQSFCDCHIDVSKQLASREDGP